MGNCAVGRRSLIMRYAEEIPECYARRFTCIFQLAQDPTPLHAIVPSPKPRLLSEARNGSDRNASTDERPRGGTARDITLCLVSGRNSALRVPAAMEHEGAAEIMEDDLQNVTLSFVLSHFWRQLQGFCAPFRNNRSCALLRFGISELCCEKYEKWMHKNYTHLLARATRTDEKDHFTLAIEPH